MTCSYDILPSIKIDEEKERLLIDKFLDYRKFKINWSDRDQEGWISYRWKNYDETVLPMAIKFNILYYTDDDKANVSFTNKFTRFLTRRSQPNSTINVESLESLSDLSLMEYSTTTEVAKYLGLTYEEFFDLPASDPNKLKIVHRAINSDFYERVARMQEEQMEERAEWKKRVLRKQYGKGVS